MPPFDSTGGAACSVELVTNLEAILS